MNENMSFTFNTFRELLTFNESVKVKVVRYLIDNKN